MCSQVGTHLFLEQHGAESMAGQRRVPSHSQPDFRHCRALGQNSQCAGGGSPCQGDGGARDAGLKMGSVHDGNGF